MVIFIKFPVMHWNFNSVLNASMLTARAAMRVYMFHNCQFCAPVLSLFFRPHEPYDDINLDDVCPPFHPPMYPLMERMEQRNEEHPNKHNGGAKVDLEYLMFVKFRKADSSSF